MKTNSKQVREAIKQHILDCVYSETGETYPTIQQACQRLKSEFERVTGHAHNLQKFPNNQDRFSDYLMGLPFHFEYEHSEIEMYLNGLGINPEGKQYSYDQQQKLYHYLIFNEMNKNV